MPGKNSDAKADAAKMATLSIVWAAAAGVAYLGLIRAAVLLFESAAKLQGPGESIDKGLITLNAAEAGSVPASFFSTALIAVPIAAVAILALGIVLRVRPSLVLLAAGLLIAALAGFAASGVLFVGLINTAKTRGDFLVALGTIVVVSVLLRLQRYMRRLYRRNPAVASLILGVVVIIYLVLANGTNIAAIVLSEIDIWLALVAFAILLYTGIRLVRLGQKLG
jgi:hypothetical protein